MEPPVRPGSVWSRRNNQQLRQGRQNCRAELSTLGRKINIFIVSDYINFALYINISARKIQREQRTSFYSILLCLHINIPHCLLVETGRPPLSYPPPPPPPPPASPGAGPRPDSSLVERSEDRGNLHSPGRSSLVGGLLVKADR